MRCKKRGCPREIEKGRQFYADVYDHRCVTPTSGKYQGWDEDKEEFVYRGHKEIWCEFCYRKYENDKHIFHYYVENKSLKFGNVKRTDAQPVDERNRRFGDGGMAQEVPLFKDIAAIEKRKSSDGKSRISRKGPPAPRPRGKDFSPVVEEN